MTFQINKSSIYRRELYYFNREKKSIVSANRLNEYITHYETLNYDSTDVHKAHLRAKRSISQDNAVHLSFQAHGKNFRLRLKRDLSVFSNELQVNDDSGPLEVDTSHVYEGHLVGKFNF